MLIPSIDLQDGKVVQLVQGERLAVEDADVSRWIRRFEAFPLVQLVDLDAARGRGDNTALVGRICSAVPCRVGGGIRSVERAIEVFDAGAREAIVGSRLFRREAPDLDFARRLSEAIGRDRLIAAVDARGGRVVVDGWRTSLALTPVQAIAALDCSVGGFLYTHVDTEGLLGGIDMTAVETVRAATARRLAAAGGISTWEEIDRLADIGVDAVVGMAIYTGRLSTDIPRPPGGAS